MCRLTPYRNPSTTKQVMIIYHIQVISAPFMLQNIVMVMKYSIEQNMKPWHVYNRSMKDIGSIVVPRVPH